MKRSGLRHNTFASRARRVRLSVDVRYQPAAAAFDDAWYFR
jgi:hypothetical protein